MIFIFPICYMSICFLNILTIRLYRISDKFQLYPSKSVVFINWMTYRIDIFVVFCNALVTVGINPVWLYTYREEERFSVPRP